MALALRELARRSRSEAEIARTLTTHGAPAGIARTVVRRLRELGYVNDEKLAVASVERWTERGFGSLRMRAELVAHGVDEAIVEHALPDARADVATARRVLQRKFSGGAPTERRDIARAARFLAARGFPAEVIDSLFDVCD